MWCKAPCGAGAVGHRRGAGAARCRDAPKSTQPSRRVCAQRPWGLPSLAIGAATVALGGAGAWGWKKHKAASLVKVGPHQWAPGEHFEDDPLPANHPLNRVVYRAA